MNNRHSGFTLAEILITLGLIGVIAAMTLPALIGGINKKTIEARLKEDYSLLQQVMQKAQFEDASFSMSIPNNMQGSKDWFKSFIEPNMKYANVCFNTSGCWHNNNTLSLAGNKVYVDHPGIGVGDDIYAAVFTTEGLVPARNDVTKEELTKNCGASPSGNNAGYYCLRRVLGNSGKIPDEVWAK